MIMSAIMRLPKAQITQLVAETRGPSSDEQDEMAIPSYLHGNRLIRWLMWRRYDVIDRVAAVDASMTVLEFGCGLGLYLPTLAARGRRVLACDLFPCYAQALARRLGLDVEFVDGVNLLPDASVDIIVAADVLEHVDDLPGTLHEFTRILAPSGRLVVSGPTENRWYELGRRAAGFAGKGDYHLRNVDDIAREMAECGFVERQRRKLPGRGLPTLFRVVVGERLPSSPPIPGPR